MKKMSIQQFAKHVEEQIEVASEIFGEMDSRIEALEGRCLTRSEPVTDAMVKEIIEENHHLKDYVGQQMAMSDFQTADDMREALDTSRSLAANLQSQVDSLQSRVEELEELHQSEETWRTAVAHNAAEVTKAHTEIDRLESELASLREQCVLVEPLTSEEFTALDATTMIVRVNAGSGDIDIRARRDFFGPECNPGYRYYLDPRPLPVLPEPEPEVPVPEVPSYLGCVKCEGEVYFVLGVTMHGELRLFNPACSTVYLLADPKRCCELYNHPEVPNSPALIAALSGEGANE